MRPWSIRARLTAWFAGVLGLVLVVLSAATWWVLRDSVGDTIDQGLADRVAAISRFLNAPGTSQSFEELREDLREYVALDPGWSLIRIRDARGLQLYRSDAFDAGAVTGRSGEAPAPPGVYQDLAMRGRPVRMLTSGITVRHEPYTVEVAVPVGELQEALSEVGWTIAILIPCGLLSAGIGGYWISRRALAPVDRIAGTARAITARHLSRRLDVPPTGDELQRLSETLNEMLARLETAFAETTRFTADASHELRTPVSLIRTTAEVALRRPRDAGEYRQALDEILREAERTSTLVEDLLTLTRGDAGVDAFQPATVDLAALAEEAHGQIQRACSDRGLDVRFSLTPRPLAVLGDRAALMRLLRILVDNAVKYTPAPGSIHVSLELATRQVAAAVTVQGSVEGMSNASLMRGAVAVLTVADTGIGIAAADLPHVFDRFYRADRARSRDSGGAGLGLSIAKRIVERHGGAVLIDSEPGRGCRVRVELPVHP